MPQQPTTSTDRLANVIEVIQLGHKKGMKDAGSIQPDPPAGGIPYPILPYEEALAWIERMGLSRAHRRLFLLIDGYRILPELVRLMGRREDEVNALLRDLEGADLIRQT